MAISDHDLECIMELIVENLMKTNLSTAIKLWFNDLKLISLDANEAIFVSPSDMKKDIIIKHYSDKLAACLKDILGFESDIIICSSEHGEKDLSNYAKVLNSPSEKDLSESEKSSVHDFKSEFTFSNFVIGSSNKFAYAAAEAVSKRNFDEPAPVNTYNPLFIYGPSGVGKTHLLYAITNKISENHPDKRIIYVKGEEFTNQLIDAIQKKTTFQFKEKYRKADVLLIDDIQFVAGRNAIQEELFNTFNAVYEENKQIILTSDRPPQEMKTLEDRLRTRFMSGLIADIQLPDFDLRLAILKQKANQNNLLLSDDILRFLAENVSSSIRQLEGVIKKLGAIQLLEGGEITLERVKNSIKEFIPIKTTDSKRIDDIIMAVSKKFNVSKDDLLSSKRNKEISIPRHICIYIAKSITSLNHAQIAKHFNRDRTTAISSEEFVRNEMDKDPDFALTVKEIIKDLNSL